MIVINSWFIIEIICLVLVPGIVGPLLTRTVSERAKRSGSPPSRVRGLQILVSIVWIALVVIGLSLTLGAISLVSGLTFSAIAGIAVTLALQTTLQNFVSGMLLLQRRFLRVGDVVQLSGVKGAVVAFGLVTTVIKMGDGNLAFVGNSNLLSGPMINYGAAQRLAGEY